MDKPARKHHYLPAGYLAGFAVPESREKGRLTVFDLDLRRTRMSTPKAEAWETDYHRIDIPGVASDLYETTLAQFDAIVPAAIRSLEADPASPQDGLTVVLNFIALTAIRVPFMRRGLRKQVEMEMGLPFEQAVRNPEYWADILRWLPDLTQEHIARLCTDPDYARAAAQEAEFFHMGMYQDTLLGLLAERSWSVMISADQHSCFICSDNPVGLESPEMETGATPRYSDRDSVITFPLNRRLALVGRYDEEPFAAEVGSQTVAKINMQTLRRATRCVYAPHGDAVGMQKDGSVGYLQDTLGWMTD